MENMCQLKMTKIDDFILKASKKHNNKYDYSLVDIKKNNTDIVDIVCPFHGSFPQQVANHLYGKGCPMCKGETLSIFNREQAPGWGWERWKEFAFESNYFDSFKVYIVKCWDDNETFYKIGRTFRTTKLRLDKTKLPYNYELIWLKESKTDAKEIMELEIKLKALHKDFLFVPKKIFNGKYECFSKILLDEL
jgi:hypothetical protein